MFNVRTDCPDMTTAVCPGHLATTQQYCKTLTFGGHFILTILVVKKKSPNQNATNLKVKVSNCLIAVGAVRVRVPLYLGHS